MKTVKILVIILLFVVLGVSLLKYFNLYNEGFSSNEELTDYKAVSDDSAVCDSESSTGGSAVPACYSTVQPDRGNDYLHYDDSEFILKTQIETPVCPNSPFEYGNGEFGSLISDDGHITTPNDNWLKQGTDVSSNLVSHNTNLTTNSTPSNIKSPFTIQNDFALNSPQNNQNSLLNTSLNYPTLNSTPEPSKTDTGNSTTVRDDKCPPCPACQRCPEPVVECKKVVNYTNAAGSGQLPVPYINDFSKF